MKLGLVVNVVGSEATAGQTTYRLGLEAGRRGHDVRILSAGSFGVEPDGRLTALALPAAPGAEEGVSAYMASLREGRRRREWIDVAELDVLLLRSNPSVQSPWAQRASLQFGRLAVERGVLVLNDPDGLAQATDKLYLHGFPEAVRPRTLVTRNLERVRALADEVGDLVLKPVQGSGGQGVFLLRAGSSANLEAIYRSVARDGYVVAQEYLPGASRGDTRIFLLNGELLEAEGRYAAVRRVPTGTDLRSNVHVGARIRRARLDERSLAVVRAVGDRLRADGMFLVGLDVVDGRLMEVNVFSPGGLGSAQAFEKVDFCRIVVDALERKVARKGDGLPNRRLAVLP